MGEGGDGDRDVRRGMAACYVSNVSKFHFDVPFRLGNDRMGGWVGGYFLRAMHGLQVVLLCSVAYLRQVLEDDRSPPRDRKCAGK